MGMFARSRNHGRTFIATCVGAAFLWALALSVSPQLHHYIHADANRAGHSCAVTAIASGNCDHGAQSPLVSALRTIGFPQSEALHSVWVQPLFLCAHVFAHAPPTHS
jgi:hypothetical protein